MQATGRGEYQLAVLPLGLGPHAAQSLQMDVDGPGPQLTAAGHGHLHPPEAVQRRGQVKHRAAHGAGRAVRQDTTALSVGGPQAHRRPLTLCLPAQRSVNGKALFHIRQRRRLPDDRFLPRHSMLAAISGSTLFFAAGTIACPNSGRPPVIFRYSPTSIAPFS